MTKELEHTCVDSQNGACARSSNKVKSTHHKPQAVKGSEREEHREAVSVISGGPASENYDDRF